MGTVPEDKAAAAGTPRETAEKAGLPEAMRETYFDDEGAFFWMDRDEDSGLEPLSWLGNHFPQGCRFCM